MVHLGWCKRIEIGVANIARSAGRQMRSRFTERRCAVMTSGTGASHDALMRVTGGFPGHRSMAGVARLCGRNMRHRLGLCIDGNIGSAMAGSAITGSDRATGSTMVHQPRRKSDEAGMTGVALRRGWYVIGRLAKRTGAVMAGGTPSSHRRICGGVVECRGCPGGGRTVANIALSEIHDVRRRFHLGILGKISAAVASGTIPCSNR